MYCPWAQGQEVGQDRAATQGHTGGSRGETDAWHCGAGCKVQGETEAWVPRSVMPGASRTHGIRLFKEIRFQGPWHRCLLGATTSALCGAVAMGSRGAGLLAGDCVP